MSPGKLLNYQFGVKFGATSDPDKMYIRPLLVPDKSEMWSYILFGL